ncbi:MAG: DNA polymerase III subunit gamma/tau [Rhodospirillales bacterium]|nr:DNA polymerase III subunit gamma/tau [Rhodospirillales bacterium]
MTETGGLLELDKVGESGPENPRAEDQKPGADSGQPAYLVLARKYRPTTFDVLLGQEVLVRTLTNAFELGRIAHAFLFVGVRGVGKTTTARIIARGLNCLGSTQPTVRPCGECASCTEALAERHLDILEIDGASHTGVDDVRDLTDAAHYRPTTGRYKVYIVDEVHMLSQAAFNALLKTLEEPPAHVVFIFCTTEVRRVPVTVLSRCQRFDLLRVPQEVLAEHFRRIVQLEKARIDDEALRLIARAADGSVRDGLSILDQAISHQGGVIEAPATREMLGFADRTLVFDLFEQVMAGEAPVALAQLAKLYAAGAEPRAVLEDLLALTHWLSRIRVAPESADAPEVPENERTRGRELAAKLSVPVLARAWQMILRALEEAGAAPDSRSVIEMAVIRLCFVADMPDPGTLVRRLSDADRTAGAGPASGVAPRAAPVGGTQAVAGTAGAAQAVAEPAAAPARSPRAVAPATFEDLVELLRDRKHARLVYNLENYVHLVRYDPRQRQIEYRASEKAPSRFVGSLAQDLERTTGFRWLLALVQSGGQETVRERRVKQHEARLRLAQAQPIVATARRRVRDLPDGMRVSEPAVNEVRERSATGKNEP